MDKMQQREDYSRLARRRNARARHSDCRLWMTPLVRNKELIETVLSLEVFDTFCEMARSASLVLHNVLCGCRTQQLSKASLQAIDEFFGGKEPLN
jgi:hypothetical protein